MRNAGLVEVFMIASIAVFMAGTIAWCAGCAPNRNAALGGELEACRLMTKTCPEYNACRRRVHEEFGQEPWEAWCRDGGVEGGAR